MNRRAARAISVAAAICLPAMLVLGQQRAAPDAEAVFERVASARERLATIDRRAMRVDDVNAIENLQRSYGYYTDKMLWEHVVDLFTDDGTLEIGDSGVYVGKDSIRRYLYALSGGEQGPLEGVLFNHLQLQPIVSVAADGRTAQGRWRALILTGVHGEGSGGNWGKACTRMNTRRSAACGRFPSYASSRHSSHLTRAAGSKRAANPYANTAGPPASSPIARRAAAMNRTRASI
jgi:hypothetical protein